jgi:hypothetical protein
MLGFVRNQANGKSGYRNAMPTKENARHPV